MAFKRKLPEQPVYLEHFKGGAGRIEKFDILAADEMHGKGRVCSVMTLQPGHEIGKHRHEGDCEVFLILAGHGKYLLDGVLVDVEPNDVLFVDNGEEHYMVNDGTEPLTYLALVLYTD